MTDKEEILQRISTLEANGDNHSKLAEERHDTLLGAIRDVNSSLSGLCCADHKAIASAANNKSNWALGLVATIFAASILVMLKGGGYEKRNTFYPAGQRTNERKIIGREKSRACLTAQAIRESDGY